MTESNLSKALGVLIRKRGGWARKIAQGPTGAGLPDIVGCYRGYGLWIETKLPGKEGNLTKLQAKVIADIKAAGGIAVVISSKAQLTALLDKIDKKKDKS